MKTLKKSLALLTPHERKRGLLVLVLVMGMALLETAGVASVMPFLAVLGNPEMLNTNPALSGLYAFAQPLGIRTPDDFLIALGLGAFVLIIVSAAYRTLTHYAMNRYIQMRQHSLATRLLETYLRQPYAFFLNRHSGDMSKTILSEVGSVIGNVFQPVFSLAASSLVLIAITALLLLVNPWLALLAAGLLGGLYALVFLGLKHKLTRLGGTLVSANKERFMAAGEAFGGIKDIKLLGREQSYLSRFATPSQQFAATQATHQTINQVPNFLIEAIIFGTMLLLTVILMMSAGGLGSQALGQILPILGLYAFAAYRMKPAVQNIYQGFASLRYGQAAVDSLYADLHPDNAPAQLPRTAPAPLKAKHSIALQHLSYTYPKAAKPALIDLNLEIPVGSAVGLVGSTGAGKTTLVDVLLGLLRPTEGAIAVDGVPVSDAQLRAWQQSLGYVPQEIFLTDTSIAENIALGIPKAQIDQAQVERCARMAQVHEFIVHDLPAQYETLVGERGVRLSGGQRQRIGIARALYHNPEVLVFDEATSALDTVTEQAVMDAIDALAHQKTIILIAHRLSTVKNCDQIVLLEQGGIKAKGTFTELTESNAQFKLMANGA
jgi:ABC-type multidrug transport system fused ATPase/permease subunit